MARRPAALLVAVGLALLGACTGSDGDDRDDDEPTVGRIDGPAVVDPDADVSGGGG